MILKNIQGILNPIAMIGVTEKGILSLKLTASGKVGHSSVPPYETAIVTLSNAINKLNSNVHPNLFGKGIETSIIESLGPYVSFPYKLMFANLWLFKPVLSWLAQSNPLLNSFIRTSTAVTMFHSGIKVIIIIIIIIIILIIIIINCLRITIITNHRYFH